MSASSDHGAPGEPRISTGTAELDRMLDGGLMPRRPYLLVGPSGTGKTTLALQFLCEGVRKRERTLFVTVEEPPNEILWNHRHLLPELGKVEVFDAIPDVMRFERTPFKDIAAVRSALPFERVEMSIRKTPELTSVEVTISALEQMLRTEVQRRGYSRVVVDSLTALQYFCMKGYEPGLGAQSFLRFLSDLRVTTLLTVESPLEDIESPERMLARGEIRLFRWELEGVTVRAVGVEKFRGSSHDVRLHPYRIGVRGVDVNLAATISRDTQVVLATPAPELESTGEPALREPSPVELLDQEVRDLLLVGQDIGPVRAEVEAALAAARQGEVTEAANHVSRALAVGTVAPDSPRVVHHTLPAPAEAALARIFARADSARVGIPPARLPEPPLLAAQLSRLLNEISMGMREVAERAPFPAPSPILVPPAPGAPAAPMISVAVELPPPVHPPVAGPVAPPVPTPSAAPPPELTVHPAPAPLVHSEAVPAPTPRNPVPTPGAPAAPAPAARPPVPAPEAPPPAREEVRPSVAPPALPTSPMAPEIPLAPIASAPASSSSARGSSPGGPAPGTAPATAARPTGHPRMEPPPLPRLPSMPEPARSAEARPLPPPPAHPGPGAPAMHVPPTPDVVVAVPPSLPAGAAAPTPSEPEPPTARKRKRAAPRRKAEPTEPTAGGPEATPSAALAAPGGPEVIPSLLMEPEGSPKPKRRLLRKKKAPPVLNATPGPVPPGVYGTEDTPSPPPDSAPPAEGS
ncbi:MAG TPA: ATPase domain-containing protein [Thermoplasmata archaeon]|nr:ATPase domain-containing protein [Thermoplasmata archaeon]